MDTNKAYGDFPFVLSANTSKKATVCDRDPTREGKPKVNGPRMSEACLEESCKSGVLPCALNAGPAAPKLQPNARAGPKPANISDLHDARHALDMLDSFALYLARLRKT